MTDLGQALALSIIYKALELGQITLKQFNEEIEALGLNKPEFRKEAMHQSYSENWWK